MNEALKYIELISKQINSNPSLFVNYISNAYKLAVSLYAYQIELEIQKGNLTSYSVPPEWFQKLEENFKNVVCKTYNKKVTSVKELYQQLQMNKAKIIPNNVSF